MDILKCNQFNAFGNCQKSAVERSPAYPSAGVYAHLQNFMGKASPNIIRRRNSEGLLESQVPNTRLLTFMKADGKSSLYTELWRNSKVPSPRTPV